MARSVSSLSARNLPDSAGAPGQDPLSVGFLGDLLGFHLRLAQVAFYRDFIASLSDLDITQSQFATLSLIGSNPGVPQIVLAATLGTDRATMMGIVDKLEARSLVRRQRSNVDRRKQELYLTPAGNKMLVQAQTRITRHEARLTSRFKPAEIESLVAILRRIHGQNC